MDDTDAILKMGDSQNTVQEIDCLDPDITKRTLGVWQRPSGSDLAKLEYLHGISMAWKE